MGVVVKEPTPIEVPKDLKHTITKDKKEVANKDDTPEAAAISIDIDCYSELSKKPFLELEEKLEMKKYNLVMHYEIDLKEITTEFVKMFERQKPRTVWYNTVKAVSTDMKQYDGILDWHNRSVEEIKDSIDLKC